MIIGILPDPLGHPDWPIIERFLKPAAKRGNVPILEENEVVFAVYGPDLLGAATARLTADGFGEVVLVGGERFRRWIHQLDARIGEAMREAGMKSVRAYGRKGWVKILKDWNVIGGDGVNVGYERAL